MDWDALAAVAAIDLSDLSQDAVTVIKNFKHASETDQCKAARQLGNKTGNWGPLAQQLGFHQLHTLLQTVHPSTLQSSCILDLIFLHLNHLYEEVELAFMQVR